MSLLTPLAFSFSSPQSHPLFVEVPVPEGTRPYLVTATRSLFWIPESRRGLVRAAVRPGREVEGGVWVGILAAIASQGRASAWGNEFPPTSQGCEAACAYVESYGLTPVEMLVAPGPAPFLVPRAVRTLPTPWIPTGRAVVLPVDRHYVGTWMQWEDAHAVVVHNAARSIALLGDWSSGA